MRAYGVHGLGEVGELSDPSVMATIVDLLGSDANRFVRACAAEAVGCVARRAAAAAASSSSLPPPPCAQLAAALLPGLALGGEEPGVEGGSGDAARHFADPSTEYKFSARNMVRENASVSGECTAPTAAQYQYDTYTAQSARQSQGHRPRSLLTTH